jgi:hypothetical protein
MSNWKQILDGGIIPLPNDAYKSNFLRLNSDGTDYEFGPVEDVRDEIFNKTAIGTPTSAAQALVIDLADHGVISDAPTAREAFYVEVLITIYADHYDSKTIHYLLHAHRKVVFNVVFNDSYVPKLYPAAPSANDFVIDHGGLYYNLNDTDFGEIPLGELPVTVGEDSGDLFVRVSNALGTLTSGMDDEIPVELYFTYEVKITKNDFDTTYSP